MQYSKLYAKKIANWNHSSNPRIFSTNSGNSGEFYIKILDASFIDDHAIKCTSKTIFYFKI